MKKVMTLAVLVGLMVLCATNVFATTVYFDYLPSGTYETGVSKESYSYDCADYQVGVLVPVEKFQFGLEYNVTDIDYDKSDITSMQLTGWKITGGYQCFKTEKFELITNLSYLYLKDEAEEDGTTISIFKYSPLLIGAACKYRINDKMLINGSVDCAKSDYLIEERGTDESYPADYTAARVKYSYLFTKDFAASLGYKWSKLKYGKRADTDFELVVKGFTLGVSYNF